MEKVVENMKVWSLTEQQTEAAHEAISDLVREALDNACAHGFHEAHRRMIDACRNELYGDDAERTVILEMLAKIGSEVGEAVSAVQHGDYNALYYELADVCIRIFDLAGWLEIDFGSRIIGKMQYNRTRPYLHGKKC